MRSDLRWKGAVIFLAVLIFALLIIPVSDDGKNIFRFQPIRLGLDLKGGIELLLAPDYRLNINGLDELHEQLLTKIKAAHIAEPEMDYLGSLDGDRYEGIKYTFNSAEDAQRAVNVNAFPSRLKMDVMGEAKQLNLKTEMKGKVVNLTVTQELQDLDDALQRSLAIINHRINQASAGMAEADVRLDGKGRINVQLPGIKTLQEARELIAATGRLTFRIDNRIVLDGTDMRDANIGFEQGKGYVIRFDFKGNGARMLEKITTENVGKKMAVYLDETMLMDPIIQDPIPNGSGIITFGNATKEEVEKNAILMKSGALPISLRVVQSTQVEPTLGQEIVHKSIVSGIIGIILVIIFMILFYSIPGLFADLALLMYAIFVIGFMALFRGVLTLPGIAGLILSIGMALDANIIIFERIKDELRNGKRMRAAVHSGFDRAYITILDSNITTLIAAAVLFFFGNGPVQGFAVTLTIGILVSMVTAIFVSRFFLEWRMDKDPDRYARYFGVKEVA
ncbi:MAG TPA: protein translocase subunit SecD [Bacillota bacterium]